MVSKPPTFKVFRVTGRIRFRNGTYATREAKVTTSFSYDEVCDRAEKILAAESTNEEVVSYNVRFLEEVPEGKATKSEVAISAPPHKEPPSRLDQALAQAAELAINRARAIGARLHRQPDVLPVSIAPSGTPIPIPSYMQQMGTRPAITAPPKAEPIDMAKEIHPFPGIFSLSVKEGTEDEICFE